MGLRGPAKWGEGAMTRKSGHSGACNVICATSRPGNVPHKRELVSTAIVGIAIMAIIQAGPWSLAGLRCPSL